MGRCWNTGVYEGFMYDSECVAVLHKYKHVAGNPLKFNIPVLTYLNEVDKHIANYACSGFGEKSGATFPLQRHDFLSKLKPYLAAQGLAGRSSEPVFFIFLFDDLSSRMSNGCFRSPSLS